MTLFALLLAGLATTAHGSICCPPLQWEAFQFITRVEPSGENEGLQAVSYDALNGRFAVSGNYTGSDVSTFKEIYDFNTRVGYRINQVKKSCETFAITEEFPDTCIPDGADLIGPYSFGLGRNVIDVIGYRYVVTKDGVTSRFTSTVSDGACIPIFFFKFTSTSAGTSFLSTGYNNVLPGIRDGSTFSPPSYCENGNAEGSKNTFKKPLHSFIVNV